MTPTDSHWSDPFKALYNVQDKSTEKSFTNDQKVTRDFSVYLMLRQIGVEFNQSDLGTLKIPNRFDDVNSSSKFAPYLAFAWYVGISSWYADWTFWGSKNITRGELTKMSYKTLIDNKDAIIQKYNDLKAWKVVTPVVSTVKSTQLNYWLDSNGNKVSVTYEKWKTYFKTAEEIKQFITQDKLVVSPDVYSKSLKDTLNPTWGLGWSRDWAYTEMFFNYVSDIKTSWKVVQIPTYLMPTFTDVNYKFGWSVDSRGHKVNSTTINLGIMPKVDLSSSSEIKTQVKNVEDVAKKMFPQYFNYLSRDENWKVTVQETRSFQWCQMTDDDYGNLREKLDHSAINTKETSNKLTTEFYNLMMKEWFSAKDWGLVTVPSKWNHPWDKWDLSIVYLPAQAESNLSQERVVEKGDYLYQIKVNPSSLMWYWNWTKDNSKLEINPSIYWNRTWPTQPIFQYILWRANF